MIATNVGLRVWYVLAAWTLVVLSLIGCDGGPAAQQEEALGEQVSALAPPPPAPYMMEIAPAITSLPVGVTQTYTATLVSPNRPPRPVKPVWSVSNTVAANIDMITGNLETLAPGALQVIAFDPATNTRGALPLQVTSTGLVALHLSPATAKLPTIGTTQRFTATGTFADTRTYALGSRSLAWTSSAPAIVSVNSSGLATAMSNGLAQVKATYIPTGFNDAAVVTVGTTTLTSVNVTPANPTAPIGTNQQFRASAQYSDGTVVDISGDATWKSSKTAIATVDPGGLAHAIAEGTTTITAAYGGLSGTQSFSVIPVRLVTLGLTPAAPRLPLGTTLKMTATGTFNNATTKDMSALVNWTSSDTSVVTVSNAMGQNGLLTPVAQGTATIRATDPVTGIFVNATATIDAPTLTGLAVNGPAYLAVGQSAPFVATAFFSDGTTKPYTTQVTWFSGQGASVSNATDSQGIVTALTASPAAVMIRAVDPVTQRSAEAPLIVTAPYITSVTITPPNASIPAGLTQSFTTAIRYSDGHVAACGVVGCSWSSANPAIATVAPTPGGAVATGVAAGATQITLTLPPNPPGMPPLPPIPPINVQVTEARVVGVSILPAAFDSIAIGATANMSAVFQMSDGATRDATSVVTWVTSDPSVLEVSNAAGSNGLVTGMRHGYAMLAAIDPTSGLNASRNVEVVWPNPTLVFFPAETELSMSVGEWTSANVFVSWHNDTSSGMDLPDYSMWTSLDPSIADVQRSADPSRATIIATGAGTTQIIVNVPGVAPATLTVTVTSPCAAQPAGLISWWRGEGATNDEKGLNDGETHGVVTYVPGMVGTAFHFEGDSDVHATSLSMPTGSDDRTIEGWVRLAPLPVGAEQWFFAGYGTFGVPNEVYVLGAVSSASPFFSQWGGAIFGAPLPMGAWTHVAVTNTGAFTTLYINGAPVGSSWMTIDTPAGTPFYLGGVTNDSYRQNGGDVDEIAVYGRALTADEITGIYNAGSFGKCR